MVEPSDTPWWEPHTLELQLHCVCFQAGLKVLTCSGLSRRGDTVMKARLCACVRRSLISNPFCSHYFHLKPLFLFFIFLPPPRFRTQTPEPPQLEMTSSSHVSFRPFKSAPPAAAARRRVCVCREESCASDSRRLSGFFG